MPAVALLLAALLSAPLSWGASATCWHMISPTQPDGTVRDNCCGPGVSLSSDPACETGNRGWFPDDTQIQRITIAGGGGYCTAATISLGTCPVTSATVNCAGMCGPHTESGTYAETCAPGTGTCGAASCAGYPKSHACSATRNCGTMRTLGSWGAYGACSATCASSDCGTKTGTRTRTRSCTAGTGQCGAASCSGVQVSESISCSVSCACAPPPPPTLLSVNCVCPTCGFSITTNPAGTSNWDSCLRVQTGGTQTCTRLWSDLSTTVTTTVTTSYSMAIDCENCGNCSPMGDCLAQGIPYYYPGCYGHGI